MFRRPRPRFTRLLRLSVLGHFVLASTLALHAQAVAPSSTQPIPKSYFGVNLENLTNYPTPYVGSLGKGSAVYWPYLEPQKGVFDWSRLDAWANKAHAEHKPLFFSNDYVPEWAAANPSTCSPGSMNVKICTSTVSNIQDWDDFVNALVTRYNGRITMYELWNEPDNSWYFSGTVAQMVVLTTHMYKIIRSLDPRAVIAAPSAGTTWMAEYWASGGVRNYDIATTHDYPDPRNPVAEVICAFRSLPLKQLMAKYGMRQPIWDTEGSWGGSNTLSDPNLQAAYVARHAVLHWACGVERFYWYTWDGANTSPHWGTLTTGTGGLTQAGEAFAQVEKWLVGAAMPNSCLMNGAAIPKPPALFHGVYTCNLTRPSGYQGQVVWNTNGSSTYTAPSRFTKYSNLAGQTLTLPASHQITIGLKPILLEN